MTEQDAYNIYRGGFSQNPPPHWDDLEPWQRDAMTVCYLQGTLNGAADERRKAAEKQLL